jgi:poly(3-hydroxybutyrate) depolymerase
LRRPLRRIFWDPQAMRTATTPRKSRKESRQARLRSSCMQSGSVRLYAGPKRRPHPAMHPARAAWSHFDLIGLCQGGWLSLVYAGRFPTKVRKLVMAGAPVDIAARQSRLSAKAEATPLVMFQSLVNFGDGRVIGRNLAKFWENETDANGIRESLQTVQPIGSSEFTQLEAIFKNWNSWTIDLPGTYYLEVIEKLYRRNELAGGSFVALGQKIDLSRLQLPMYLLAGSADEVVAPEQLLAVERLVGTQPKYVRHEIAPCNHLGLFMGKRTLEEYWPKIVRWMKEVD